VSQAPRVERIYPLSPMQEGMLVASLLRGDGALYLEQVVFHARGSIDPILFDRSLQELARRHAVLRTAFVHEKLARPRQAVLSDARIPVRVDDLRALTDEGRRAAVEAARAEERARGIDVSSAPLFRASLFRTGDAAYEIGLSFHHIILDGWSLGLLLEDLLRIYRGLRRSTGSGQVDLPPPTTTPYERFIQWIETREKARSFEFWDARLQGYAQPAGLPRLRPFDSAQDRPYRLEEHVVSFDEDLTAELQKIAGARQATLSSMMRALWSVLLARYNDASDVAFGAVVSGRPPDLEGAERLVGLCINTIPVRTVVDEAQPFGELLRAVQRAALDARDHEYLPLAEVQGRTPLRADLFDHVLVYENYPRGGLTDEARGDLGTGFRIDGLEGREQTSYDFNLIVGVDRRLVARFNYNAAAYDASLIAQVARHFTHLARQVAATPDLPVGQLEIMPAGERNRIVVQFNAHASDYPRRATVHGLFEEQAAAAPDRTALVSPAGTRTYAELDQRANALAAHLCERFDIQPGRIVAVAAGRDEHAITGILGVLKAGGAYLPIDPSTPLDRAQFMLRNAGVSVVLGRTSCAPFAEGVCEFVDLENDAGRRFTKNVKRRPASFSASATDLAYVMYTSGSSGQPKGVMVEHRGVARLVRNTNFITFDRNDRVLLTSAPTFDVSVFEQWGALLNGGELHLAGDDILLSPDSLGRYLEQHAITVLWLISPLFNQLADYDAAIFAPLRCLLVGGDVVSLPHARKVRALFPRLTFVNGYGPTENTTFSACHILGDEPGPDIPIGAPISNSTAYVLDRRDRPVPIGVAGELCVGGDGVARGYLNRPELTAERFLSDPFQPGGRLYRTGDLARWREDGTLSFLGRNDQQVKIRGFRIELGEIEQCLASREDVKDAVVVARASHGGHKELVAYIMPRPGVTAPDPAALRATLTSSLPEYMVPTYFVGVDRWPLTSSGKVDRKALPDPRPDAGTAYIAPRTDTERALADLWQDVLGAPRVGLDDNFFDIGGDSIKALQIASRLRQRGLVLRMRDLFTHRTLGALAPHVSALGAARAGQDADDVAPLTPIQSWLFDTCGGVTRHFNQAVVLAARERMDDAALGRAVAAVVAHHDALRTAFITRDGAVQQQPRRDRAAAVDVVDLRGAADADARAREAASAAQRSMDPAAGVLIKAVLLRLDEADHLLIAAHHLAVDVVSWHILVDDLAAAYDRARRNEPAQLPPGTHSVRQWSRALREYASSDAAAGELPYWQRVATAPADMPAADFTPAEPSRMADREVASFTIDARGSRALLHDANQPYGTRAEDLLIAALAEALESQFGVRRARLWLEGHGREDVVEGVDVSRTVGWFTSLYPVLLTPPPDREWRNRIRVVKEIVRRVPRRGVGYGILRYLAGHTDLATTGAACFNFIGSTDAPDGAFSLSRLDAGPTADPAMPMPYPLDVTARVTAGQIEISVAYPRTMFSARTIEDLIGQYRQALASLTAHCQAQTSRVLTPSDLGDPSLSLEELDALPVPAGAIEAIHPLTPIQTGIVFHALRDPSSTAYLEQSVISLAGDVDPASLERAFAAVMSKWDLLRSIVVHHALRHPRQIVLREARLPLTVHRIADLAPDERERRVNDFVLEDRRHQFDLAGGGLMRATLFETAPRQWTLVWAFHHVLMDGWSVGHVVRDLLRAYGSIRRGDGAEPQTPPRYAAYLEWLDAHRGASADRFWAQRLEGFEQPTGVPRVAPIEHSDLYDLAEHAVTLDARLSEEVRAFARAQQITVNTVFQAAWGLLLQRYHDTDDVVFGAVVSGRAAPVDGLKDMVGLFINTVPVRVRCAGEAPFDLVARQLQTDALAAQDFEHIALADIQKCASLGARLLDHILIFENYPIEEALRAATDESGVGFRIDGARTFEQTNYDLNVTIVPDTAFRIRFTFNSRTYRPDFVNQVGAHFCALLASAVAHAAAPVRALSTEDEAWRPHGQVDNARDDRTVVDLFNAHVRSSPDRPAVIRGDEVLTYREVAEHADRIAGASAIQPGELIGILTSRPDRGVITMLAILRSGGAFLPLDPAWPSARIDQIVADSGCRVLTDTDIDAAIEDIRSRHPAQRPAPTDLAYVIYTSGSTGRPKGVMIEHRNFFSYITWAADRYVGNEQANFPLFTSLAFDLTLTSVFVPLTTGNAVVVYEGDAGDALERILRERRVSIVKLTPAHLRLIRHRDNRGSAVRRFVVGGENLEAGLCREIAASFDGAIDIFNEYGPTEATVGCMIHRFDAAADQRDAVPIGSSIAGARILLLDRHGREAPRGALGEICIAGAGVARGYLGQPDRTAEKFVLHGGDRMYRTGDVGRRLADGTLEFVGRRDGQVKVRGHRVELGEIELHLLSHPDVAHAVVTARRMRHDHLELVAYVVMKPHAEALTMRALREHVTTALPDALVPSYLTVLDALPLTPHGKIDRAALPDPLVAIERVDPDTPVERLLCRVWCDVLGLTDVGVENNFFEVGGDSIKAIQISAELQKLNYHVTLADVLSHPTVRSLADRLVPSAGAAAVEIEAGAGPLSPIQRWFFALESPAPQHYNQAVMLHAESGLDPAAVQRALDALVEQHASLRTVFEGGVQRVMPAEPVPLWSRVVPNEDDAPAIIAAVAADAHTSLDLARGPVFTSAMFDTASGSHLLLIAHHLAVDGVSWRILLDDFASAYRQAAGGGDIYLPPPTQSYLAWVRALDVYAASGALQSEAPYWTSVQADANAHSLAAAAGASATRRVKDIRQVLTRLDSSETRALLGESHRRYGTEINDLLLSALASAVRDVFGAPRIGVLLEGHGREEFAAGIDIRRTAGWFTSLFPIVLDATADDPGAVIQRTRDMLRAVPARGMGYGVLRYLTTALPRAPWPLVRFNYLGQVDDTLAHGLLKMSQYDAGPMVSPDTPADQILDVQALARGGELQLSFTYHPEAIPESQAVNFSQSYGTHLRRIVAHCTQSADAPKAPDIDKIRALLKRR
jgi:amino acid adenylation domain-containing protein/non-ribosomal peptide synthase protein (TIGR01720 family)